MRNLILPFIAVAVLAAGCSKENNEIEPKCLETRSGENISVNLFFDVNTEDEQVNSMVEALLAKNAKEEFVTIFSTSHGFPQWSYAVVEKEDVMAPVMMNGRVSGVLVGYEPTKGDYKFHFIPNNSETIENLDFRIIIEDFNRQLNIPAVYDVRATTQLAVLQQALSPYFSTSELNNIIAGNDWVNTLSESTYPTYHALKNPGLPSTSTGYNYTVFCKLIYDEYNYYLLNNVPAYIGSMFHPFIDAFINKTRATSIFKNAFPFEGITFPGPVVGWSRTDADNVVNATRKLYLGMLKCNGWSDTKMLIDSWAKTYTELRGVITWGLPLGYEI